MKRLYLETNFIVGEAFQQDVTASQILPASVAVGAEICLPSICILEALATVARNAKTLNRFANEVETQLGELKTDNSATANALLVILNQALIEKGKIANERRLRLVTSIKSLQRTRFVECDQSTALQAVSASIIDDPADNLILHVVCNDASAAPATDMVFFSRNRRDFGSPQRRRCFRALGSSSKARRLPY